MHSILIETQEAPGEVRVMTSAGATTIISDNAAAAVTTRDVGEPPLTDAAGYLATLPKNIAANLRRRQRLTARFWTHQVPVPPGWTLRHTNITTLREDWGGLPAGTLVIERRADQGRMWILVRYTIFDMESNDTIIAPQARSHQPKMPPRVMLMDTNGTAGVVVKTVVDASLTFFEFALFAAGPYGLAAAGGVAVLHMLFDQFFPHDAGGPPKSDPVIQAIEDQFHAQDMRNAANTIITYSTWLTREYQQEWGEGTVQDERYLEEFMTFLHGAFNPGGSALQALELMRSPTYRFIGLNTFLFATAVLANLRKVMILLDTMDRPIRSSPYLPLFVAETSEWAVYAHTVIREIEDKINIRMSQIGQPELYHEHKDGVGPRDVGSVETGWRFVDQGMPGGSQTFSFHIIPVCCVSFGGEDDCRAAHAAHVKEVRADLIATLNASQLDGMKMAADRLAQVHQVYRDLLHPPVG